MWVVSRARGARSESPSPHALHVHGERVRVRGSYSLDVAVFERGGACAATYLGRPLERARFGTADEIDTDLAREAYLHEQGFRIFRAHNGEVYENLDGVCDALLAFMRGEAD